jgi:hypothetical protein
VATSKNNPDIAGFRFLFRDNEGVLAALTFTAAGLILMPGPTMPSACAQVPTAQRR